MIKAKEDTFHLGVKALIRNPKKEILLLYCAAVIFFISLYP